MTQSLGVHFSISQVPTTKQPMLQLVVIVCAFLSHWKEIWNYTLLNPKRSLYKVYCRLCMKHLETPGG